MTANEIRRTFLDYFQSKNHKIVPSAPLVNKNDPTLMFTNAGMNQFKDYFLGNQKPLSDRIADTQKCLRVSGKHNDLEDVGIDGYHHTMFEMLGNWSFGDYFKEEAIEWAWELLTVKYGIDKSKLYVTVFKGDDADGLPADEEAIELWKRWIAPERILLFSKKDNFWEMGETGPCGPCSEIHVDLRSDEDRAKIDGSGLVNADHPDVIEIWNLVFIQFNRKADGSLESLPSKHIDTGMGFERLCRVVQKTDSNYDTGVFLPFIQMIEGITLQAYEKSYALSNKKDIAFRVVVDHLRAVAFAIADGQLPSNTGAGYVIRRILRRAVRYYYSFLNYHEPLLCQLIDRLCFEFAEVFPELELQKGLIESVVREEEKSFLRTLDAGLKRIESIVPVNNYLQGKDVFELYDTYGFPIDLTRLIAGEMGYMIDEVGFQQALNEQKERSRSDAKKSFGDWDVIVDGLETTFLGYDQDKVTQVRIIKQRTVVQKDKPAYHIVLDKTPFYPEGGGQVGDTGTLTSPSELIHVLDTYKENDLIIHLIDKLPLYPESYFTAEINAINRRSTEKNHSSTHLLHAALRTVLGNHVQQKGSLVHPDYLRFDFSHFQKLSDEEIIEIERIVNNRIRQNIPLGEERSISIDAAKASGAMMLFGEKYGETVRMISFDPGFSVELCGGCHVSRTGSIGFFKIIAESAVAAGVRRIEAITSEKAEQYVHEQIQTLKSVVQALKSPQDPLRAVVEMQEEIKTLKKEQEQLLNEQADILRIQLAGQFEDHNGVMVLKARVPLEDVKVVKTLAYNLATQFESYAIIIGLISQSKPQIMILFSKDLTARGLHAGNLVRLAASAIKGGGGGQDFFATAGGSEVDGLDSAIEIAYKESLQVINK
jgi:alanyl-tRNA synthetase